MTRGIGCKRCQRGFLRRMELERIKDVCRAQPAPFLLFSIFAMGYTPGIKPPEAVRGQDALQSGAASRHHPIPFCSPGEGLVTGTGPGPGIFSPDGSKTSTQMGRGGCALRFPAASTLQPLPAAGAPPHSLAEGSPRAPSYQQLEVFPKDVSQTLQALQNHPMSLSLANLSFWPPYSHQPLGLWEAPGFELASFSSEPQRDGDLRSSFLSSYSCNPCSCRGKAGSGTEQGWKAPRAAPRARAGREALRRGSASSPCQHCWFVGCRDSPCCCKTSLKIVRRGSAGGVPQIKREKETGLEAERKAGGGTKQWEAAVRARHGAARRGLAPPCSSPAPQPLCFGQKKVCSWSRVNKFARCPLLC